MTLSRSCCEQGYIELPNQFLIASACAILILDKTCTRAAGIRYVFGFKILELLVFSRDAIFKEVSSVSNMVKSSFYHLLLKIVQSSGVEPRPSDEDCEAFH